MMWPIGTRVRLRGSKQLGTVFAVPYTFRGEQRVGVAWDASPGRFHTVPESSIELAGKGAGVPAAARPLAVGALYHAGHKPRDNGGQG